MFRSKARNFRRMEKTKKKIQKHTYTEIKSN